MSPLLAIVTPVPAYPPPVVADRNDDVALLAVNVEAFEKLIVVLLMVAVPPLPPIFTAVVAAPPIFTVVVPELNRFPVPDVVVSEPPFTATLLAKVPAPALVTVKFVEFIKLVKLVPEKLMPFAIVPDSVNPLLSVPPDC